MYDNKENIKNKRGQIACVIICTIWLFAILLVTLLLRTPCKEPWNSIWNSWSLFRWNRLDMQVFGNVIMFIPLTFFSCLYLLQRKKNVLRYMILITTILCAVMSVLVELLQAFTYRGTFQVSDIVYNTLGGFLGGFACWIYYNRKKCKTLFTLWKQR